MQIPANYSLVPGYVDAVKRENDVRDAAMLNLNTRICGVEIKQMTLRHWIILDGIDSPLICGINPEPVDVIKFLWVLSPEFRIKSPLRQFLFSRRHQKVKYGDAVVAIRKFVEETFQDRPPNSGDDKWTPPQASFAASIIYSIASKFHWTRESILDMPIKEIFQHMKLIRMSSDIANGEKAVGWNESDLILIRFRRKVREERRLEALEGQQN